MYTDGINEFNEDDFEYFSQNRHMMEREGTMSTVQKPLKAYINNRNDDERKSKFSKPQIEHADSEHYILSDMSEDFDNFESMEIPRESEEGTEYIIETDTIEIDMPDMPDNVIMNTRDIKRIPDVSPIKIEKFNQLADKRKQEYQRYEGTSKNKKIVDMLLQQK